MTRIRAIGLSACVLVVVGCGVAGYDERMTRTLDLMKYQQKLEANLTSAPQDPYKSLSVWVRPPKPLSKAPSFMLTNTTPGLWDAADSFSGSPTAEKAAGSSESQPVTLPAMRMHILARKKKPQTPKKGEENAPAPETTRGKFSDDVSALLASDLGMDPNAVASVDETKKGNRFKKMSFSGSNGDTIQVYLAEYKKDKQEIEAALIFDIPPPVLATKMNTTAIPLCLESFGIGPNADRYFNGGKPTMSGEASKEGGAAGPVF